MYNEDMQDRMKNDHDEVKPSADEVAEDILVNKHSEYDISAWKSVSDAEQAEVLRELIGIYAHFEYDHDLPMLENRSELLSEIKSHLELTLKVWAERELG